MKKKVLISLLLVITILTAIFSTVYATDEQKEIPSNYDLRNEMTIKPENQLTGYEDEGPVCYNYAKTKMIETYIQKTKGISYNLSETYYAWNGESKDKTFVLESDFPNKMFAQIPNIDNRIEEVKEKAVVKDFSYLYDVIKNKETIKKYITKYGGVLTTVRTDNQWNNYKGGIYHKEKYSGDYHAVTIIGWDDNYSKDNFYYEKPENDGAWLVLNTWGSNWGNNGTAWISYDDNYNFFGGVELVGSITLADDEIIETNLTNKKQEEIKETETPVIEQETQVFERNQKETIFIIVIVIIIVISIILYVIKKMKKEGKTDNTFYKIITSIGKIFKVIVIAGLVLGVIAVIIFIVGLFII